ncbi:hypothetical protein [Leifsonia sp. Leaf264]|nr:hypothetical protein [Leifsonia sp. Leaf264]
MAETPATPRPSVPVKPPRDTSHTAPWLLAVVVVVALVVVGLVVWALIAG